MVFFVSNILFAHEFSGNELNRELAVFFENAEENVKRGQDASAIKNYSIVIEELPDFVKAYINRGNAYFRLGVKVNDPKKYQLAINDYSKVIELDPLFVTAYRLRSRALSHLGKEKEAEIDKLHYYFNQNLVRNADGIKMNALLEKVNKSISDNPDKAKGYLDRGNIYIKFKRWELAWVDLNKAIDLDPKNWQSYFDRATVYMAKKIYNQTTIDDLNKAQELASADKEVVWECLMRKANVHSKGKRIEESIANYTKAIELNPKSWFAYYERSFVYGNKEMLAESMNDFSQVIALNPMHSKVYLYRGALYKMLGKLEESKADLKKYKFLENQ
jgi:tetratricopeptide (TPR) repeat protein